jgi:hypothetical protein
MMKDHVRGKKEIDRCIPVQALDIWVKKNPPGDPTPVTVFQ